MRISPTLYARSLIFRPLPRLRDSSVATFRKLAFDAEIPYLLPRGVFSASLPAIESWFHHPSSFPISSLSQYVEPTTLREAALQPFAEALVSTELTQSGDSDGNGNGNGKEVFQRHAAPFGIWLAWALAAQYHAHGGGSDDGSSTGRLTIAQTPLAELPEDMRAALPAPDLIRLAGRGDIYDASSLWMGVAPTVTPLHRDPNPNVLAQLAGRKRVRLLNPERGRDVWRMVSNGQEGKEDMMVGEHRQSLESAMWTAEWAADEGEGSDGYQAELAPGDALFIPTGWWHAVHGVGRGVTASVNWWFR